MGKDKALSGDIPNKDKTKRQQMADRRAAKKQNRKVEKRTGKAKSHG